MVKAKRMCHYCDYCKQIGRSEGQSGRAYGRAHYYCEYPEKQYDEHGRLRNTFVGFGDLSYNIPLQRTYCPRWCPLERKEELDK